MSTLFRRMTAPAAMPRTRGVADGSLLTATGVSRSFQGGGTTFSLHVDHVVLQPGVKVAVVGPSGCGKSTLLGLLSLALRPDHAETLTLNGVDAAELWRRGRVDALTALRSRFIGFVPQTAGLLPFLSIGENIALPQRILGRPNPGYLRDVAHALGIDGLLRRHPAEVSVGQRQRAAVARALSHRPPILLADEPTASVHPAQADEILALLFDATQALNTALVISTHDGERARAAGFALAPCRPDATASTTMFSWAPGSGQSPGPFYSNRETIA
jgi:putative ABC transport system ATP-binding protein